MPRPRPPAFTALLWLAPALVLLAVFSFWPVAYGSYLAFTDYSLGKEPQWVGWQNFADLLQDEMFRAGLINSLKFLLIVPLIQIFALLLALLVNQALPGMRWFRAAYYVPVVTTVSVVGIMWSYMLHEQGALNYALQSLHLINEPIGWLSDDSIALFAVMFVTLWRGLGWYMVMYLAGLQAIPQEVQEAALLDGANAWQRFWRIHVPLLKPSIVLCTIMSLLAALKTYQEVDVLTQGGPMNSTVTALFYAYDQGFKHLQLAKGLAASMLVSLCCIVIAALSWRVLRPRQEGVNAQGDRV